jgi:hypothetical protein
MKFKSQSIVAFAAIFVSIATLIVYLYQAHIMQRQQVTSVWPYLQWGFTDTADGVYIHLENKGIGPAIVKKVTLKLDGDEFKSFGKLFEALGDTTFETYTYSTVSNKVLAPGEAIRPFFVKDWRKGEELLEGLRTHSFEYLICYCSVYGDCWSSSGLSVKVCDCD